MIDPQPAWWKDRKGHVVKKLPDGTFKFEDRRPIGDEYFTLGWCALCENFGHDEDNCYWPDEEQE